MNLRSTVIAAVAAAAAAAGLGAVCQKVLAAAR
jgi:hypothetical protein